MTIRDSSEVQVRCAHGIGHIELDRPKALNALTLDMVDAMRSALESFQQDPQVRAVVVTGAGGRGLCAGGDIKMFHRDALSGGDEAIRFWANEYRLNAYIAEYDKPYIAVMSGIVMGGGVGISAHGKVRIVTDDTKVAMPETGIGFAPDVGGAYLLAHAPGELGTLLALTGLPVGAADAIAIGLADVYVPHPALADVVTELLAGDMGVLERQAVQPPPSELLAQRVWADEVFAGDDVAAILDRLTDLVNGGQYPWAQSALDAMHRNSPLGMCVALRCIRQAARLDDLRQTLNQDFRTSVTALRSHDLVEGIRAQVIDKDRNPQWSPAVVSDVTPDMVDQYFADLGDAELGL